MRVMSVHNKKIVAILFLLLTVSTIKLYGQSEKQILTNADTLIANKKYNSAFKLLNTFDPKNEKPDIVLLKEKIALNYFVESILHQMFAFKNIKRDQNIYEFRGKRGNSYVYSFPIDTVLKKLIKKYPKNCQLYKGLADFYYDVYSDYRHNWLVSDDKVISFMKKYYATADRMGCTDYLSYFHLGYVNLAKRKYGGAIQDFQKSIKENKNFTHAYYNLAYAYLFTNDRSNALKYAKISLAMYADSTNKSDAAQIVGEVYSELNDYQNSIKYYELANQLDPGNYYVLRPLLYLYINTDSPKSGKMTDLFFNLDPDNPTIYNDLNKIYYNDDKDSILVSFYQNKLSVYKDSVKVLGNLNFYLGRIYFNTDRKLSREYFIKAKKYFSKVFKKNNQVFDAIEQALKQTE